MEITIILLLLALTGQKELRAQDIPPVEKLLKGDWKEFLHSDWFQNQTLGGMSGKEIAQAADAIEKLSKYKDVLRPLLQGDFSGSATRSGADGAPENADAILKNLGGLAALAQGAGKLGSLFGATGERGNSETDVPRLTEETPFAPIAHIADAEIIYALTNYFAA